MWPTSLKYNATVAACYGTLNLVLQCEGKPYNEKSDMWALGCILYEMANLQKTFEGTNLPALVNKIMKVNLRLLMTGNHNDN